MASHETGGLFGRSDQLVCLQEILDLGLFGSTLEQRTSGRQVHTSLCGQTTVRFRPLLEAHDIRNESRRRQGFSCACHQRHGVERFNEHLLRQVARSDKILDSAHRVFVLLSSTSVERVAQRLVRCLGLGGLLVTTSQAVDNVDTTMPIKLSRSYIRTTLIKWMASPATCTQTGSDQRHSIS